MEAQNTPAPLTETRFASDWSHAGLLHPRTRSWADLPPPPRECRILIVDPDEASRCALMSVLDRRRYAFLAAGSVLEALVLAQAGGIDILLCTMRLPDGGGQALLTALRTRNPDVVGLAMGDRDAPEEILQSISAGFLTHLVKPLRLCALRLAFELAFARLPRGVN